MKKIAVIAKWLSEFLNIQCEIDQSSFEMNKQKLKT